MIRRELRDGIGGLVSSLTAITAAKPTADEQRAVSVVLAALWPSAASPAPARRPGPAPGWKQARAAAAAKAASAAKPADQASAPAPAARQAGRQARTPAAKPPATSDEDSEPEQSPTSAGWNVSLKPQSTRLRARRAQPRARSISATKQHLTQKEKAAALPLEPGWDADRPRTRGECAGQPRPCPWAACRFHLYLDVNEENGSLKLTHPHIAPDDMEQMPDTCALDVADRADQITEGTAGLMALRELAVAGGPDGRQQAMPLDEVARYFNLSGPERIRQILAAGLQQVRVKIRREDDARRLRVVA